MQWIDLSKDDDTNTFEAVAESGFAKELSINDLTKVAEIITDVLSGQVAQRLFEGLTYLEITRTNVKMTFVFSLDAKHMEQVEKLIGRRELQSHRLNFIMYVFALIDQHFKLDNSLPQGFQDNVNMPQYIK